MTSWGVLGAGAIAGTVVGANAGSTLTRFVAVAGRDSASARGFAERYEVPRSFGSYDELLASDVEAVYIALPMSLHAEWTIKALQAGKHVLCEKPFTVSLAQARDAAAASRRAGRRLVEGFMWRLHPQTVLVRRMLADGDIGELATVRAALTVSVPPGDIRRTRDLGGGALGDLGCYCVSAIRLFAGLPETVFATARTEGEGLDLRVAGVTRGSDGVLGVFDVGLDLPGRRDELDLIGTDGVISIPDPWVGRSDAVELRTRSGTRSVPVPDSLGLTEADTFRNEFGIVSAALDAGEDLPFGEQDLLDQAATLEALHTSYATGMPQQPVRTALEEAR